MLRVFACAAGSVLALGIAPIATTAPGPLRPSVAVSPATTSSGPLLRPGGVRQPAVTTGPQPTSTMVDSAGMFHCQMPTAQFRCYGPSQIRRAYSIQPLIDSGWDGSGKTVTIVDGFSNPTMASDLASFDSALGLSAPVSFRTIAPFGITPFVPTDPNQVGWSSEIALDVEWAHAVAPGAAIVLALARSGADPDLVAVERYVIDHGIGDVISMSYGEAERCMNPQLRAQEHALFAAASSRGVTLVAGSGDQGAAQYTCYGSSYIKAVSTPASDPYVTGVGGTRLNADLRTGQYVSESVWNEPAYAVGGGGGFSSIYPRPGFQAAVAGVGAMRGLPDVAYEASEVEGVIIAWGSSGTTGEFWVFGGTSIGAPQWAGIVAIADQMAGRDLGWINPALYALGGTAAGRAAFHDITVGNNSFRWIAGYAATRGWDAASGLGSPIASKLVAGLVGG